MSLTKGAKDIAGPFDGNGLDICRDVSGALTRQQMECNAKASDHSPTGKETRMTEQELMEERKREYLALAHAMQSGVGMMMNVDPKDTQPKFLRTGINTAMSDHGALVNLLVEKGLITELEYYTHMCFFMRNEVRSYELKLSEHFGRRIQLG